MSRTETALAYLKDESDRAVAQSVVPRYRLATDVRDGGLGTALEEAANWSVAPDYLILDSSDVEDPVRAVEQLASEAPAGETDVIMIGERNDIQLYRALCNIGVSDYLLKPVDPNELSQMLERVIARRREQAGSIDPQRLVVVTGSRGGVGASTVATSLAHLIAERHQRRTLLVDLDLHGGTQYLAFNTDPSPGLFEILQAPQRVDALFLERTLIRVSSRLALLSGNAREEAQIPTEPGLDALLAQARQGIDSVVLDLPRDNEVGRGTLYQAGTVVIVASLTLASLRETVSLVDGLERRGAAQKIIVVVNRVGEHRSGVVSPAEFQKNVRREILQLPFDARTVTQSMIQARPLVSYRKPISKAIIKVADQLPTAPRRVATSGGLLRFGK